jgi:DNA repair photolyase
MFVRWSGLASDLDAEQRLPGYRDPAAVRRFEAPEAMDMRFYEVQAKSVLNRVPERSPMPFRWTINPYRGCSHACCYCISGDTDILMADGRTKPMREVQVGERIYGTVRDGAERRFAVTTVEDKWSSIKPAHVVALEDGTRLIASPEHRFLSTRGWKHVGGGQAGAPPRLHDLSAGSHLIGLRRGMVPYAGMALRDRPGLRVQEIRPLGETMRMYDITTGSGDFIANGVVSHNCFARPTHTYLGFDAGRDFEREIVVKVNAPEVVRAELSRRSWRGEHVALGTNTDPYQWVEGRYRLMEGIWEALRDAANPCSILTKSPLLLRDIELMRQIAAATTFTACLSIPTLDEKVWRETEPRTPNPRARLEAVTELNRAGIPTGVLIAPLMPGINDSPAQVEPLLEAALDAGARNVAGSALHLRGEVRDVFMDWMRLRRPDLIEHYARLYRTAYAPQAERERLAGMVRRGGSPGYFWRSDSGRAGTGVEAPRSEPQQSLF